MSPLSSTPVPGTGRTAPQLLALAHERCPSPGSTYVLAAVRPAEAPQALQQLASLGTQAFEFTTHDLGWLVQLRATRR